MGSCFTVALLPFEQSGILYNALPPKVASPGAMQTILNLVCILIVYMAPRIMKEAMQA